MSRQAMSTLPNGRVGLSAAMAIRFEKSFDLKTGTPCRIQTINDLSAAREYVQKIKVKPLSVTA